MASKKGLHVLILNSRARAGLIESDPSWGLGEDGTLVEKILRECNSIGQPNILSVQHMNPIQYYCGPVKPEPVDLAIHLEIPCRAAWSWATKHIVLVNPEWWPMDAWNWVLDEKDCIFVFKSKHARSLFPTLDSKRCRVLSWRAGADISTVVGDGRITVRREFLYLVGASTNKLAAARSIVAAWDPSFPPLTVVGTERVLEQLRVRATANVRFLPPYATNRERVLAQREYGYHVVASAAEGYGYTFAEAATVGALPLWTGIPIYDELYGNLCGTVGRIACTLGRAKEYRDSTDLVITIESIQNAVRDLLRLPSDEEERLRGGLKHVAGLQKKEFRAGWKSLLTLLSSKAGVLPIAPPPKVPAAELPHVGIITLTYNRKAWWGNMVQNILSIDYPREKLTWVIADDSDGVERVDSDVMKFQSLYPNLHVKYLSIPKKLPIGEKRNKACSAATDCTVFAMMDDDDHYPSTSVAVRVSWLLRSKKGCVYSSTLPMYDCRRYISAINVPPLMLAPEERISEASLCFTRAFWEARKFPNPVSVAEGEAFLADRIQDSVEIPPNGIIVSFIHKGNSTSRRVPTESEPNGCHYGFDDQYFTYISRVGGAETEEEKS